MGRKAGKENPMHTSADVHEAEVRRPPELLVRAKQFLCWERYPDLAIQLIRIDRPVGYWFPPESGHKVLLFYRDGDEKEALFLLFHEVGHYLLSGRPEAANLESRAWELGKREFAVFVREAGLPEKWLDDYDAFAVASLRTYGIPADDYRPPGVHLKGPSVRKKGYRNGG